MVRLSGAMIAAVEEGLIARNPVKVPPSVKSAAVSRSEIPALDEVRSMVTLLEEGGARYQSRQRVPRTRDQWRPMIADMVRVAVGTDMRLAELCGKTR